MLIEATILPLHQALQEDIVGLPCPLAIIGPSAVTEFLDSGDLYQPKSCIEYDI